MLTMPLSSVNSLRIYPMSLCRRKLGFVFSHNLDSSKYSVLYRTMIVKTYPLRVKNVNCKYFQACSNSKYLSNILFALKLNNWNRQLHTSWKHRNIPSMFHHGYCTHPYTSLLLCALLYLSVHFFTHLCTSVLICTLLFSFVYFCTYLCTSLLLCALLYSSVHFFTHLCNSVQFCTLLFTFVHYPTFLYTFGLLCPLLYTSVRFCTLSYISVHLCTLLRQLALSGTHLCPSATIFWTSVLWHNLFFHYAAAFFGPVHQCVHFCSICAFQHKYAPYGTNLCLLRQSVPFGTFMCPSAQLCALLHHSGPFCTNLCHSARICAL